MFIVLKTQLLQVQINLQMQRCIELETDLVDTVIESRKQGGIFGGRAVNCQRQLHEAEERLSKLQTELAKLTNIMIAQA